MLADSGALFRFVSFNTFRRLRLMLRVKIESPCPPTGRHHGKDKPPLDVNVGQRRGNGVQGSGGEEEQVCLWLLLLASVSSVHFKRTPLR